MKKEDKSNIVERIQSTVGEYAHFYLTDIGGLNAEQTSQLRRECNQKDVKLVVVKNTLFRKALENAEIDYSELYDILKGETSVMFTNNGNVPAKVIKSFSKKMKLDKPALKAAYVEESFYIGQGELETLVNIKSKDELIGEVIGLLQSPIKNVVSALQSGGTTIQGVLKTLEERN